MSAKNFHVICGKEPIFHLNANDAKAQKKQGEAVEQKNKHIDNRGVLHKNFKKVLQFMCGLCYNVCKESTERLRKGRETYEEKSYGSYFCI